MHVDPRLNDVDDCLYRVAVRVLVVQRNKVLLIKEIREQWWAFPGGGVDHGETLEACLEREVEEELGVPAKDVSADFQIVHYNIGSVVDGVPRMNIFFRVSVPQNALKKTDHVAQWKWFTKDEFLQPDIYRCPDKAQLVKVLFDS